MNGLRSLLVTLALAAGLVVCIGGLALQSRRWLPVVCRNRVLRADDQQAAAFIHNLAALDELGTPALVDALDSSRKPVAEAAKEELFQAVSRWGTLDPRESSSRLAGLAEALAERIDRFGPAARTQAAQLVAQILLQPLNERSVARYRVVTACEQVLRTVQAKRPAPSGSAATQLAAATKPASGPGSVDRRLPPASGAKQGKKQAPGVSRPIGEASPFHVFANTPQTLAAVEGAESSSLLSQPAQLLTVPERSDFTVGMGIPGAPVGTPGPPGEQRQSNPLRVLQPPAATADVSETGIAQTGFSSPSPTKGPEPIPVVSQARPAAAASDALEVMRRLRSADPAESAQAREELLRRGLSDLQIELGGRLFDPDPAVRRRLVRVLPEIHSIDTTSWLLELCRDEDPQVRLEAFTLLATVSDPQILRQLAEIARQDPDPNLRRQAERLAAGREEQNDRRARR
jgi:hypothetical protein